MYKRILSLSGLLIIGATSAASLSLRDVNIQNSGPKIIATGTVVYSGIITPPQPTYPSVPIVGSFRSSSASAFPTSPSLLVNVDFLGGTEILTAIDLTTTSVGTEALRFLSADLADVEDGSDQIRALFKTIGGTASAEFGDWVVVKISTENGLIAPGSLDSSASFFGNATVEIQAANINPPTSVPLPAGGVMLIGSIMALACRSRVGNCCCRKSVK